MSESFWWALSRMKADRQFRNPDSEIENFTRGVVLTLELQNMEEKFEKVQFFISMWMTLFRAGIKKWILL